MIAVFARRTACLGQVCVFIDEANTCSNTCLTTEVLTCNTLDGEPLPDNIFWVGAINPLSTTAGVTDRMVAANQFTGVEDAMDVQDYIVYALPPSAHKLIRNVGEFGKTERRDFVSAYLQVLCLSWLP
jgi:hypothetical protein